jgi:hypothetical protein
MKTIAELEQQIELIKAELEKHKQPKKEFIPGKWYKLTENYGDDLKAGEVYRMLRFQGGEDSEYITLDHVAFGRYHTNCLSPSRDNLIPATESEIKEALTREAERRGFKEGVHFKSINEGEEGKTRPYRPYYKNTPIEWVYFSDQLYCNTGMDTCNNKFCSNPSIYIKGQWAEIITEPQLAIGEYEVKFNGKESITVGCQTISKETIQTILDKLK